MTVGFQQTSYQASEDPPLNGEVCAMISNLMGDLECDLTVTFGALSNTKSGKYDFMLQDERYNIAFVFHPGLST